MYDALKWQEADAPFRRPASGEFEVNAGHSRFGACCLLMACAIARHNMWTADFGAVSVYQRFGLNCLCPGADLKLVTPEKPEEQMLFLSGLMDTIDPVKNLYVRAALSTLDEERWMKDYLDRLKRMSSRLDTKAPDTCPGQAVCYYPRQRGVERTWPGGITDRKIDSICLYAGSGVAGKAGRFYQLPNAYQTFNLLMMEETQGERIR